MRLSLLAGLVCSVTALGAPAFAQETADEEDPVVIYGMWPGEGVCTAENTVPVAFADLLRDAKEYDDQCVSTETWIRMNALFLDQNDMSLQYPTSNTQAAERRIGLYAKPNSMLAGLGIGSQRARVKGKLWDCSRLHGSNVIMVMGYCHYTGGPIIGVSEIELVE